VIVSGRVNLMVFDKTGTLTEDGLQVYGFRGSESAIVSNKNESVFGQFTPNCKNYQPERPWWTDKKEKQELLQDPRTLFLESLATCHSITYVNGELIGDPLDVKMFEATGWILEEQNPDGESDELVLGYVRPPHSNGGNV
jgi:cation-transporting ATPase 13A3/4/5